MRRLLLLSALVALLLAPPASAARRIVDRGIVVRVAPSVLVLRELDGSRVRIRLAARTAITLDGFPATVVDLRRGQIAFVVHFGRRPARAVRAFTV